MPEVCWYQWPSASGELPVDQTISQYGLSRPLHITKHNVVAGMLKLQEAPWKTPPNGTYVFVCPVPATETKLDRTYGEVMVHNCTLRQSRTPPCTLWLAWVPSSCLHASYSALKTFLCSSHRLWLLTGQFGWKESDVVPPERVLLQASACETCNRRLERFAHLRRQCQKSRRISI